MQHRYRVVVSFNHDLRTSPDPRQQRRKIAYSFSLRDVNCTVSHGSILEHLYPFSGI